MTRRLLPGVGVGDEPPNRDLVAMVEKQTQAMTSEELERHDIDFGSFSFSTYRSTLVVRAIQDAGGIGGRVDVFQSLVADYFARAGIDLADPARQGGSADPSAPPLLGMLRKTRDEDAEEKEKEHS